MKLTYFALAVTGAAAQSFIDYIVEEAVNSIYTETDNGYTIDLSPYYKQQWAETPSSYSFKHEISVDGVNTDDQTAILVLNDDSFDFTLLENGFMSNNEWYADVNPGMFHAFDTYNGVTSIVGKCTDGENDNLYGSFDATMDAKYLFNSESDNSQAKTRASGTSKTVVTTNNINHVATKKVVNTGYPEFVSLDAFGLGLWDDQDINVEIDVNANMNKCRKFMRTNFLSSKPKDACKVASSVTVTDNEDNSSDTVGIRFEMFSKFIALLAKESGAPEWKGLVVRGEDTNNAIDFIGNHNFYGLYAVEGQFRKQIAQGNAELILRAPGCSTWENILIPHLENKMEPWGEFFDKITSEDFSSLSNLVYHFDKFLASFDDEFDFSEFIRLTHIASEVGNFTTEDVAVVLAMFNEEIVKELEDSNDDLFDDLRNYVEEDIINNGFSSYESSFGGIF